jgi:hypothetical protein
MTLTARQAPLVTAAHRPADLKALRQRLTARLEALARDNRWSAEHRAKLAHDARGQAAAELATLRQQARMSPCRTTSDRPPPRIRRRSPGSCDRPD